VYEGLRHGLETHGAEVIPYRLDERIEASHKWLHVLWRQKNRERKELNQAPFAKPHNGDVIYHASVGVLEMAWRRQVDVVLVVSGMLMHPDAVIMMKRTGLRVVCLFTESPYDQERELMFADLIDGCWTQERSSLKAFQLVNKNSAYLPHGWHPNIHRPEAEFVSDVQAHDVVFVGSGFPERITFFNAIDWAGIDIGLYGTWKDLGLKDSLLPSVRAGNISNEMASALYRKAAVGLNLYRTRTGWRGAGLPVRVEGESLSPRAYELAACGVFHLSAYRPEVREVFGELVPTFQTPQEAEALIRSWLPRAAERAEIARQLPARVAEMSWVARAASVLGDLERLLGQSKAA
jgi:hypothetical protein